ncbi:hypothetical protein AU190_10625 [Mycolicibacterium acapulense]|uniref:Uncharacterized protein n=1 Tax=Mycobacterium lehmannii TaxID=2048550 RepID=A0A117JJS0_9MYCO|nr:hypothetical protein [Mycobacterium lehmannii]KUI08858.1 hypothetical protein AU190_10625 [Mycolicibacterium acapulense]KUI11237.1 hypothetical protein AU191_24810 [Mycolicibacterium acapulense]KUI15494.1 hypothetical protein AU192_21540 [Mycobacterium lehmannii]
MAEPESGQWNVAAKENRVYLERTNDDGELLFGDSVEPHEARQLARALTKFADKLDDSSRSRDEDDSDDSDDDDESDKDENDDKNEDDDDQDDEDDDDDQDDDEDKDDKKSD